MDYISTHTHWFKPSWTVINRGTDPRVSEPRRVVPTASVAPAMRNDAWHPRSKEGLALLAIWRAALLPDASLPPWNRPYPPTPPVGPTL